MGRHREECNSQHVLKITLVTSCRGVFIEQIAKAGLAWLIVGGWVNHLSQGIPLDISVEHELEIYNLKTDYQNDYDKMITSILIGTYIS